MSKYDPTVDMHAEGGACQGKLGKNKLVVNGNLCVRASGPLCPIYDCDEQLIVSSVHPLGKSHQAHLPIICFDNDLNIAIQDAVRCVLLKKYCWMNTIRITNYADKRETVFVCPKNRHHYR